MRELSRMDPEPRRKVQALYHASLEVATDERCGKDEELPREVESFLARAISAEEFIERAGLEIPARLTAEDGYGGSDSDSDASLRALLVPVSFHFVQKLRNPHHRPAHRSPPDLFDVVSGRHKQRVESPVVGFYDRLRPDF